MKNKKDILFLCQYYYPEYISSAVIPTETAECLAKAGYSVEVLCGYPKEYSRSKNERAPLKEIHNRVRIRRLSYLHINRANKLGRLINFISFFIAIYFNFFKLKNYKVIFVYSNPPILPTVTALCNKLFQTKVIFICFDIYPEIAVKTHQISETSLLNKFMRAINHFIFKHTTKVIALSNEMKDFLLHNRGLNADQVHVIPTWCIDKMNKKRGGPNSKTLLKLKRKQGILISYFGNLGICQDMETILQGIRRLKDDKEIHFLFAGHGSKLKELKQLTDQEKLKNVTVLNYLHGDDFLYALRISDCFVVSLVEGLQGLCVPSKTYSYLSAGKPIIAIMEEGFDIAQDLIKNEAGIVIRQGDHDSFIEFVKAIKTDDKGRKIMGENSKELYQQKYTKETCTAQYVQTVKGLLEG